MISPRRSREFFAQVLVLVRAAGHGAGGDGGAGRDEDRRERVEVGEPDRGGAAETGRSRRWRRMRRLMRLRMSCSARGRRGDEVPEDAWRFRARRDERIRAALARLEAERTAAQEAEEAKAEAYQARRAAGQNAGRPPESAAVAMAELNLARVLAARAAQLAELEARYAAGQPRRGRAATAQAPGIDDFCRVKEAEAKVDAARARAAEAGMQGRRARGTDRLRARAGAEHHRPGLAADAGPRRRVHPGLQHRERRQRRQADHRHRADR